MSCTKRQLVMHALSELGIASYEFDPSPGMLQQALERLDMLMAAWTGRNIRIGYTLPSDVDGSDLDDQSGVPDWARLAVITALAIDLAPTYGKIVSTETRSKATQAWNMMLSKYVKPRERQLDALPAGAGAKTVSAPFLGPDEDEDTIESPDESVAFTGGAS